jgi:hypothetical protein
VETPPLAFADVLERESVRLHGPSQLPLPSRWSVTEDEILDAGQMAHRLAARLVARRLPRPPRWRRRGERGQAYEADRAAAIRQLLTGWASGNAPDRTKLKDALNELLGARRWLRDEPGFGDLKRLPPFDKLPAVEEFLPAGEENLLAAAPDGVANLNRQMLEALFPHELRPAAETRLGKVVDDIHARAKAGAPRRGLAISGGGIRSATFALGILQGLARRHILEKFDFVSTVSGGGYVGSWLSSWARRDPWGIRGVAAMLTARPTARLDPEPPPIQHLRAYSNYLTPRLGALSADTWALIATYLRNLLLNWLVLVPLLVALVTIPRIALGAMVARYPRGFVLAAGLAGLLTLGGSLISLLRQRPIIEDRRRPRLTDGKFIAVCVAPLFVSALLLALAWAWNQQCERPYPLPLGWTTLVAVSIGIFGAGFFGFQLRNRRAPTGQVGKDVDARRRARIIGEIVGSAIAGAMGGALLWLAATKAFGDAFVPLETSPVGSAVRWAVADLGALSADTAAYVTLMPPLILGLLFLQATLLIGIASKYNHDFDREWWARASGWVLIAALAWIVLCAVSIYGPVGIFYFPKLLTTIGGGAGLFSLLAGWSAKTKPKASAPDQESLTTKAVSAALGLAVPLFCLFLIAAVSLGTSWLFRIDQLQRLQYGTLVVPDLPDRTEVARELRFVGHAESKSPAKIAGRDATVRDTVIADVPRLRAQQHLRILEQTAAWMAFAVFLAAIVVGVLASFCIGVNVFSMHAMYRNRLVRAYLGASRWVREPNRFTGFDPRDNLDMHELRPEYVWWHSFRDPNEALDRLRDAGPRAGGGPRMGLGIVYDELQKILGSELDSMLATAPAGNVDRTLVEALNTVIATCDLIPAAAGTEGYEAIKPLRNRRFIELALGDVLYPAPRPLFCIQDVNRAEDFVAGFFASPAAAASGLARVADEPASTLIGRLNGVLLHGIADDALPGAGAAAAPFEVGNDEHGNPVGVPRLILDRLRLDAALAGLVAPLQPAKALHLVDICLNLTSGDQLAWQQRQAESFSISPLAAGNPQLGYRDTRWYGDVSLGTAVTISGAAASPNMGYHSSPALAFLMTLFNVRLGWWLGNPGIAGQRTYRARNPLFSLLPLLREATGNTDDAYPYVYLSDGGHFENLGLYELVQRRCHRIFVSDAGADPEFAYDDLGNAVRKIRVDLGIPVQITHIGIIPPSEKKPGKYCAVGCIDYRAVDGDEAVQGRFLYVKPVVYQEDVNLPRDVFNYSRVSTAFPHEPTSDQWFSESQFESYRRLGEYAIDQICQPVEGPPPTDCDTEDDVVRIDSLDELIESATTYLTPTSPS